jgi:uncharacterized protein YbaP (TraB family)
MIWQLLQLAAKTQSKQTATFHATQIFFWIHQPQKSPLYLVEAQQRLNKSNYCYGFEAK